MLIVELLCKNHQKYVKKGEEAGGSVPPSPPPPNCHAVPHHDSTNAVLDCRQDTLVFVLLTWLTPSEPGLSWSHQTTEHVIHSLVCLTSGPFCASRLEKSFLWDNSHADQFVAYSLSTDRLTPAAKLDALIHMCVKGQLWM